MSQYLEFLRYVGVLRLKFAYRKDSYYTVHMRCSNAVPLRKGEDESDDGAGYM